MYLRVVTAMVVSSALLAACGKSETNDAQTSVAQASSAVSAAPVAAMPDSGSIQAVQVGAEGTGHSAGEAVNEAIKLAILQVNGSSVDMSSAQFKFAMDIATPYDSDSIRAAGFAETVQQRSKGAVTGFKIDSLTGPGTSGLYKVKIEASVAKYVPPSDSKKLKIVVGSIKFDVARIELGDAAISTQQVAQDIRQQIVDALSQTGRFSVLDRDTSDVQGELDMITSGQAPAAEIAKLGQAMSADVIWVGHINTFEYRKNARKLVTSDRELVSYAGGWSISQRIVNVATRQVMEADTLQGAAPSIKPTTLGARFDSTATLRDMESDVVSSVVSATLMRTFPVTVISREGNDVVLSQGGQSIRVQARYRIVSMGAEMKDPQTGDSLGRIEKPCCEVVIDRVTPKMSYGRLENVSTSLDGTIAGSLQVREIIKSAALPNPDVKPPQIIGQAIPHNADAADMQGLPASRPLVARRTIKHTKQASTGETNNGRDANW